VGGLEDDYAGCVVDAIIRVRAEAMRRVRGTGLRVQPATGGL
jgi:hypothetical protein